MLSSLRGAMGKIFSPLARFLLKLGVGPDAVTVVGTLAVLTTALWAFPTGHLKSGALLIGLFVFTDALDGTMARMIGREGVWGAFLDSTLDRLADAAIFVGLAIYFINHGDSPWDNFGVYAALAALCTGFLVSYARARAEGLGLDGNVGFIERSERLVISLVATLFTGIFAQDAILAITLMVLAVGSFTTFMQRVLHVRKQAYVPVSLVPVADRENAAPSGRIEKDLTN